MADETVRFLYVDDQGNEHAKPPTEPVLLTGQNSVIVKGAKTTVHIRYTKVVVVWRRLREPPEPP